MSDRMSVAEAREWLPMAESYDVNANISRLLRTAISQAEQIERLQAALDWVDECDYDPFNPIIESLTSRGRLLPEDMEAPK